ncbi:serine/threonine-protein kinase [Streptomyces antimicrobicus]|uniref:non-specific serine/threonine protein kinase n=1 Tax=Streptomyces antimicrobicus TaxID=2883108 RepID=A0ABS8B5Y3_9ACTN|nr:serine/threonine-protein kinase [Streptomyces antimicrobicus]MCB5179986.1 serine/threonine protein kinase [Streptomyces antimicrobicus]
MSEEPGRVVAGRYRLLDPLGRGATSLVWRARDEQRGGEVAVKEVRPPAGPAAAEAGPAHGAPYGSTYERLAREARATARIGHPGVLGVLDVVVTDDGRPWIVTELVRGLTLAEVLAADGPLTPRRAADVGAQVLDALRAAHAAGLLHRGLHPGRVLLGNDGRVVLGGFGLLREEGEQEDRPLPPGPPGAREVGAPDLAAPDFLAPERVLGLRPTPASDLWSLGALLYTAVEGRPPFRGDGPTATLRALVEAAFEPPRRAGPLTPVLTGLLRTDPAERLSAQETARLLHEAAGGGPARPGGVRAAAPAAGAAGTDGTATAPGASAPAPAAGRQPGPGRTAAGRTAPGRTAAVLALLAAVLAVAAASAWLLLKPG